VGQKLNGTHQFLVSAGYINLLGDSINTTKKKNRSSGKEVGLELNAEKTRYKFMSHHQNARKNHYINIANRSSENVAKFKYLDMIVPNQILMQEEIKSRLNLGNTCYHSVHNLLSSYLLSKNIKIEYTKLIFSLVLFGCETWCLSLRVD
jgi:hypothetical protein